MSTERIVTVSQSGVAGLEKAIRSLVRAARRAGITPEPTMTVDWATKREMEQQHTTVTIIEGEGEENARTYVVPVVDCRIQLPDEGFKVDGQWRLLTVVQRVDVEEGRKGTTTNELFASPKDLPKAEAWRHSSLECEHCKAKRTRTKTLVVEDTKTGECKQLGKECATLFLGDRLDKAVSALEFQEFVCTVLSDLEPRDGVYYGGGRTLAAWDAEEVMANACACVRERGWQPSRIKISGGLYQEDKYVENPEGTGLHVCEMLTEYPVRFEEAQRMQEEIVKLETTIEGASGPLPDGSGEAITSLMARVLETSQKRLEGLKQQQAQLLKRPYTVTEADTQRAVEILDWLRTQTPDLEKDAYLAGLQAAYAPGWISEKRLRFAVSGVRAKENAERQAARAAELKRQKEVSQHVGVEGVRGDFVLTLKAAHPYEGQFPGVAYKLSDAAGNVFTWLTSSYGLAVE